MPTYNIIKFKNLTPLHIGTGKENQYDFSAASLHSDTLSAALAALRAQGGKTYDLEDFLRSFTISSTFPFWDNICFLPKIQGKINVKVNAKEEHEYRKQLKKVKYIDVLLWNKLMQGEELIVEESQLNGDFLIRPFVEFEKPYTSQVNQRVSIPRVANINAEPFFFNWTYFHKKAGLYCLIDVKDKETYNELLKLFELLGETGLGTDRSVGGGKFETEAGELLLPEIKDANQTMLLSLYIPAKEEIKNLNLNTARYELLLRGGYMAGSSDESLRHLRKRSVYAFNVGSLFPTTKKITGEIVNLTPEWNGVHEVFRSGRPFYLPVKINEA